MIATPTMPDLMRDAPKAEDDRDDWPLEEINKPLDSPEEYVKTEQGPADENL